MFHTTRHHDCDLAKKLLRPLALRYWEQQREEGTEAPISHFESCGHTHVQIKDHSQDLPLRFDCLYKILTSSPIEWYSRQHLY